MQDILIKMFSPYSNINTTKNNNSLYSNLETNKSNTDTYINSKTFGEYISEVSESKNINNSKGKLSKEEIEDLANKYDPTNMTQKEYDEFIEYLLDKGVINSKEASYGLGNTRIVLNNNLGVQGYLIEGTGSFIENLTDAGGNAIKFAEAMKEWKGSTNIRELAFAKILSILRSMQAYRD